MKEVVLGSEQSRHVVDNGRKRKTIKNPVDDKATEVAEVVEIAKTGSTASTQADAVDEMNEKPQTTVATSEVIETTSDARETVAKQGVVERESVTNHQNPQKREKTNTVLKSNKQDSGSGIKKIWLFKLGVVAAILLAFAVPFISISIMTVIRSEDYQAFKEEQVEIFEQSKSSFVALYEDVEQEVPAEHVSEEQIDELQALLERVSQKEYLDDKNAMLGKLEALRTYLTAQKQVVAFFDGNVMKSDTGEAEISRMREMVLSLPESQQKALLSKVETMELQYQAIAEMHEAIAKLYSDAEKTVLRTDLTQALYEEAVAKFDLVLQDDIKDAERGYLETAKAEIDRKIAEERRIAAERAAAIAAAWVKLNVPYHSQNAQEIYNGCEVASLLMGLQYKGYMAGMNLRQYVEMVPKSDNPFEGFTHSIYDIQPKTVPHWIAPAPLAKFGRETSGANVQDITGASVDQLIAEVRAGNPVIIYLTYLYRAPKEVVEGAPLNLHVMLLTGHNSSTGALMTTDPWTGDGGQITYELPRSTVDYIYNSTGKRAVVIR